MLNGQRPLKIYMKKSIGNYCVFFGNTLVFWSSRKQQTISRSSIESEYRALANLATKMLWMRSLLQEIKFLAIGTSILWRDNLSAQSLAANPVLHARSKHIKLDIHFSHLMKSS